MTNPENSQKIVKLSAENLARAARDAGKKGLPPVHLWNPPDCGDIDMRIARDGTWYYLGTPIGRPALVRLFSTILRRDGDRYVLVTPVEKVGIVVDDAPFVAVDFNVEGAGETQVLTFETNLGDVAVAGADHPLRFVIDSETNEPSPYVHIRGGLEALIDRKSFYRLVNIGSDQRIGDESWFGIRSSGVFFPICLTKALK
ncbi:MAG: DUF1285 domain-containing protein [Deltaproteobacteria bacterium]